MSTAVGAVAEGSWWTEKGPRAASTVVKVMEAAQPDAPMIKVMKTVCRG